MVHYFRNQLLFDVYSKRIVLVSILIVAAVFTTPTDNNNQPCERRIGLLDKFIIQIQLPAFIIDFILVVLLFIPTFYFSIGLSLTHKGKVWVYPLLIIGQRFIEIEFLLLHDDNGGTDQYTYECKHICFFYVEYAHMKRLSKESRSNEVELSTTVVNRIATVEYTSNPITRSERQHHDQSQHYSDDESQPHDHHW